MHIPFVRQLIDKPPKASHDPDALPQKYFVILIHSFQQEMNPRSCFPSTFLHDWDYWFVDTSSPGKAFHLQKMLEIFIAKLTSNDVPSRLDGSLYDLDHLFDDCLWEFCSRLRISTPELPEYSFQNNYAREFYQRQTSIARRVQCLKTIFHQANHLQQQIIGIYHEKISMHGNALQKNCNSIYQICKDTLCGKHLTGLIDVLQARIRSSLDNFISGILKYFVDDYGLENIHKLADPTTGGMKMLELIDYATLTRNNDEESSQSSMKDAINFNDHFSCVPQTPFLHHLRQHLMVLIDQVKVKIAEQQDHREHSERDYHYHDQYSNFRADDESLSRQYALFRNQLIEAITNDPLLAKMMTPSITESFIYDSVQIQCQFVERNFHSATHRPEKTVRFLARWLNLTDEEENRYTNRPSNRDLWQLANVCTVLEHELNDLLSFYSACRITDHLNIDASFYDELLAIENNSRSKIREKLFALMFTHLWDNLAQAVRTRQGNNDVWVENYNLISRYYPSEQVLGRLELVDMKDRIEFMNLAYLILLNEQIPQPITLVQRLLNVLKLSDYRNYSRVTVCEEKLPEIVDEISQYCQAHGITESTLMIDIQQWIIRILKSSYRSTKEGVIALFKFLNQPNNTLSLPMKQFLFDQLCDLHMQAMMQPNRPDISFWDRLCLLPTIVNCIDDLDIDHYRLPYHPSVIANSNQNQILLDLYFFYLRRLSNEDSVQFLATAKNYHGRSAYRR